MSDDIINRLRQRRMLAADGPVGTGRRLHAKMIWVTSEPDPDCAAAADEIERLRAEVEALRNPWQPIETAPLDGQWFVAARFCPGHAPMFEVGTYDPLVQAKYEPAENGLFRKVDSIVYEWEGFNNFQHMTHWMPLPAPPEVTL